MYSSILTDSTNIRSFQSSVHTFQMTLKILCTHVFDTGIDVIYCTSFNKIGKGSLLKNEQDLSSDVPWRR